MPGNTFLLCWVGVLNLCVSGLLWMMVVKTDQSSNKASWRKEYQRREARPRGRRESHVMGITIKKQGDRGMTVGQCRQCPLKKEKWGKLGRRVTKWEGRAEQGGNQKGILKARLLQSSSLFFPHFREFWRKGRETFWVHECKWAGVWKTERDRYLGCTKGTAENTLQPPFRPTLGFFFLSFISTGTGRGSRRAGWVGGGLGGWGVHVMAKRCTSLSRPWPCMGRYSWPCMEETKVEREGNQTLEAGLLDKMDAAY